MQLKEIRNKLVKLNVLSNQDSEIMNQKLIGNTIEAEIIIFIKVNVKLQSRDLLISVTKSTEIIDSIFKLTSYNCTNGLAIKII